MIFTQLAKRLLLLGISAVAAMLLAGCGGGGGSASAGTVIHNDGTFAGSLAPAGSRPGSTGTTCTLRINGTSGTAAFKSGTYGDLNFVSYTADIVNVDVQSTSQDTLEGTVAFDMTNFSQESPFQSLHWDGTYTWNGQTGQGAGLNISGTITGTDANGNPVSIPFSLDYAFFPHQVSFTGNWTGDIDVPVLGSKSWSGTFTRIDDSHTQVAIAYDANGAQQTITVNAVTTNISLSGDFDGSAFVEGAVGHFYVERDSQYNDDNHFIGAYMVSLSGENLYAGVIHGVKTTSGGGGNGGGGGNQLTTGYYDGTFTPDGSTTAKPFKVQITSVSTPGGAAILINGGGTSGTSAGWRVNQINQDNSGTCEFILDQPTQGYQAQLQMEGTVSNNTYTGTYNATTAGGPSETGSFTIAKRTAPTAPSSGTYTVTATGGQFGSGTLNATLTFNGINVTVATTVQGIPVTASGIAVGTSFVGEIPTTSFGQFTEVGDYEGTFSNSTTFSGSYSYTGTINDQGTLAGSKTG